MMILEQLFLGVLFMVVTLFTFSLPGYLLLQKLRLKNIPLIDQYVLSSVVGIVLFTLSAYILAAFHVRFLMWIFPAIGIFTFYSSRKILRTSLPSLQFKALPFWFYLVMGVGMLGQLAINVPSGLNYGDGVYFWSSHGHDGVWHLALMEEFHKNIFPFQNPEFAGHTLQNYHFFVDLLMSEISRLFGFSNLDLYFRQFPLLFSLLLGLSSFAFIRLWSKNLSGGIWGMFFIYFCGSFGYFFTIPRQHNLAGEALFWVTQTQSVIGNPPHMAAFIVLTTFLYCFYHYCRFSSWRYFLLLTLLGGAVIEFKVYAGLLILGGLLTVGVMQLLLKRDPKLLLLFLSTFLLAFGIYFPNSASSQDFIVWQPWWFIRTMVVAPDRLDWLELELRRQTYLSEHNWKRVIYVESIAFFIFMIGNLGMRVIGFWTMIRFLKKDFFSQYFNLFFLAITMASFFIPVFFVQKGVAWNAIQFNQYFLLLMGFVAAMTVTSLLSSLNRKSPKIVVIIVLILLSIPTQLGVLLQFYTHPPLSKISENELEALNYLKNHSSSADVILTGAFNGYAAAQFSSSPIPIYAWYETGYVSAFTGRHTFLADQEQLDIMGYHPEALAEERKLIFPDIVPSVHISKGADYINNYLKTKKIDYIYLVYDQRLNAPDSDLDIDLIFKNNDARIYKVR